MPLAIIKDEIVFDGKYTQMTLRYFKDRYGKIGVWETLKRKIHGKIVTIMPITDDDKIVLIKIYRIPLQSYVLELCAGFMDKKDKTPKDAAQRELLEETGYTVRTIKEVSLGPFNAGLQADTMAVFLGFGAYKVQNPTPEGSEDIRVVLVPRKKILNYLQNTKGNISMDIKIYIALFWLEQLKPLKPKA